MRAPSHPFAWSEKKNEIENEEKVAINGGDGDLPATLSRVEATLDM